MIERPVRLVRERDLTIEQYFHVLFAGERTANGYWVVRTEDFPPGLLKTLA